LYHVLSQDFSNSKMDVKSLFKSGKKSIKAFKIATGPVAEVDQDKSTPDSLEAWETPAPIQPTETVKVNVDDYKAEQAAPAPKSAVSWQQETEKIVVEEPVAPPTSAYVPPSQRRAESAKAMPSLNEAAKITSAPARGTAAPASTASSGGPTRLRLITSASKKAMEEEEKKKDEERKIKEAEKQARKEELKAQLEKTASAVSSDVSSEAIKAAPLDEVYSKYIGRAKTGRKLTVVG
jgi:hypothetical protein